jgi:peptidoglycan/LPS O-acetylase OafA/YrhL
MRAALAEPARPDATPPRADAAQVRPHPPGGTLHVLQALRAVAAWLVVLDHAILDITRNDVTRWQTHAAWDLGSTGVYVFFVISGFIMVHISWRDFGQAGAATRFLRRRLARIVPLYWLATLAAMSFHRVSGTHGADAGWADLIRSMAFIPSRDGSAAWNPILPQGWTLSYEMMFYAFFAASLAWRRGLGLGACVAVLAGLSALGPVLPDGAIAHLASPIVLWFALGMGLGVVWRRGGYREPGCLARVARPLDVFGDASYCTYLVHGLVLTLLLRVWVRLEGGGSWWFVPCGLLAVTAAGLFVHAAVERPLLALAQGRMEWAGRPKPPRPGKV